MAKINIGERVGKNGKLAVGCSASIFDEAQQNMLLIRRTDNHRWAVPGGYMEPGESLSEACQREVREETGLAVEIRKLIGVYTSPNLLLEYADGNKWQLVVLHFEAVSIEGEISVSDETAEIRYFSQSEAEQLEMSPLDRQRMIDGFSGKEQAIICDDFIFGAMANRAE
jgi:ADP-ribose pyrophosphatase YjhB (NUDIX family)